LDQQVNAGSVGSVGSVALVREAVEGIRNWLKRYIHVQDERDLDILALWIFASHVAKELYTSPRLLIDSPLPGSGKTTLLEHISKLAKDPVQIASISSPALLARLTANGIRTLLLDEIDRSLDPKRPGVNDLIAILNSGYKVGGTRPVNVANGKDWDIVEMPTFAPVAMAGNTPLLPDDTRTRCLVIRLLPDNSGQAQESDWEELDIWALQLKEQIVAAAESVRELVAGIKPSLPKGCVNRFREKWKPLKRISVLVGKDWEERVDSYILNDIETIKEQSENGDSRISLQHQLLKDLWDVFEGERKFKSTESIIWALIKLNPDSWSDTGYGGKAITPKRLSILLNGKFGLLSQRVDGVRGYTSTQFVKLWQGFSIGTLKQPAEPAETAKPAGEVF
jgi:hypothetical protein